MMSDLGLPLWEGMSPQTPSKLAVSLWSHTLEETQSLSTSSPGALPLEKAPSSHLHSTGSIHCP